MDLFGDGLPKHYTVQYIDDEDDQIVVSSDDELQEGFRVAVEDNRKSLKIHVTVADAPQMTPLIPRPQIPQLSLKLPSAEEGTFALAAELDTPPVSPREPELEATLARERELKSGLEETEETKVEEDNRKEEEEEEEEEVLHKYVVCDGCGMNPIQGIRYKSSVVEDFDLCSICEEEGKYEDSHAPFLKIRTPDKTPKTIVTILAAAEAPNWRQ